MNIEEIMKDPSFNIDSGKLISFLITKLISNEVKLNAILEIQVKLLELQKEKTGQELESACLSTLEKLNDYHEEEVKSRLLNVIDSLSVD